MSTPSEPPPPYEAATKPGPSKFLDVPQARNGITPAHRRSMEDEQRPLPNGWVRSYDKESNHQFFVDTRSDPPKSIWHHPYDDEEYLRSLSPQERENVTRLHRSVSLKDIAAESSDEEGHHSSQKPSRGGAGSNAAGPSGTTGAAGTAAFAEEQPKGLHKFGRKMKDRVTNSTHEEREKERAQRAEEEQQAFQQHLAYRKAMSRALQTGQPQFLGKGRDGHDIYIESPNGPPIPNGARGYNPYSSGPYADPNARFVRPNMPYNRPMGYGYGGGYGFPLAAPMMGGLLGGAMLGGLMF